ncbi:MAG TPA: DUF2931 family protein [Hymenobacter sp.]|jgi:hypothetical protein
MQPYQTEKFTLSASPGAANGYPATIDEARFLTSTGGSFPVPYGHFLDSGWGGSAVGWAVGDALQPAPDILEIRWFSYTEDKFYQGRFLLPQQRIYNLLKQGLWDRENKKQVTYDDLAVCVAPTGVAYVWLVRDGSNKVLIGRYQAQEVAYDYARHRPGVDRAASVREGRAKASPEAQRAVAAGTVSAQKWDNYLKTYPWKLAFGQPLTPTDMSFSYLNAEATGDPVSSDLAAFFQTWLAPTAKPVPKACMLYVAGAYGRKKLFKVKPFDEQETMAAFQTLHQQHPQEPITLFLDTDEQLSKATLSLRAGTHVIPLPKSPVQLFNLP